MRQATGNANITVITITIIGILATIGCILIPKLTKKVPEKACCINAGGIWQDNTCVPVNDTIDEDEYNKCIK